MTSNVQLNLPKFKVKGEYSLSDVFKKMGKKHFQILQNLQN